MIYAFIAARCDDLPVRVCCRTMKVSTSGFYDWRGRPPSAREVADEELTATITTIHSQSRRSYGSPRVWDELRLGMGHACSRKRVERLMRLAGLQGAHRRRGRGCTRRDPAAEPSTDLVNRNFVADGPDRLWLIDITEHPTGTGKLYLAAVLDVWSRRIVGWSIADHLRTELVADALQMAVWRRRPPDGQTILHSDHGTQFTSWAFGRRIRLAGLVGSMGSVGDCYDNALIESFFGTLQLELLDEQRWESRTQLASAIFEWIEAWYNPHRRHTSIGSLSPNDYEKLHTATGTGRTAA